MTERAPAPDVAAHAGDSRLVVRPFGYTAEEAVVRQVGDRPLFLGNIGAARPGPHEDRFRWVVSLTADEEPLTSHHHPLVDGPGNEWASFAAAVDETRRLHGQDGGLLVHCEAGISRSTTVIAAALAVAEDRRFVDALHRVQEARPAAVAHPVLHRMGVSYVAARA